MINDSLITAIKDKEASYPASNLLFHYLLSISFPLREWLNLCVGRLLL